MSDFHGRIMNLQPDYAKPDAHAVVYKRGFRDARHVAAEIGLEADALLVRLNEAQSDAGAWEATAQHHYEEARAAEARLAEAERDSERLTYLINWLGFNDDLYMMPVRDWDDQSDARKAIDEAMHAVSAPAVCQHGIRHPWECRECADAAWEKHKADSASAVQSERCCLDYPRCDCNSPPEPDNEWHCSQYPGCECFAGCREKALEAAP